jgi:hypothetical protein
MNSLGTWKRALKEMKDYKESRNVFDSVCSPVATWVSVSLARNPTSIPLVINPEKADSEI